MNEPIAILGTGQMGRALAGRLARAGLEVALGSREPERAATLAAELRASLPSASIQAGGYAEMAAQGAIVLLALGFGDALILLPGLAESLAGKLVVEPTTPWEDEIAEESAAERLDALLPRDARLVGAWKTTFAGTLESADSDRMTHDVLLCGADADAKRRVAALVAATGMRAVDCGGLDQARILEGMVRMMGTAARSVGVASGTPLAWKFLP